MRVVLEGTPFIVEWTQGSHYGRVFAHDGFEVDVFSFAWEKDKASELDFTNSLERWLSGE